MALPSFLQAMFTPQRSGPGQMAWRDVVNEDSGEFSTGDTQEMYWKPSAVTSRSVSGPTTRRLPPPNETTGMGQNAGQDIQDAIRSIAPGMDGGGMGSGLSSMSGLEPGISSSITETALEPGGMSSISEAIQTSLPGEMSVQGGGLPNPRMISTPSNFGGPTPDELGIGGGGAGSDLPNMTYYNDYLPRDSGQGDYTGSGGYYQGLGDEDQEGMPARYNRVGRFEDPISRMPIAQFLKSLFSAGGAVAPSANTQPSASDPMPGLSSTGSDALARHYFRS